MHGLCDRTREKKYKETFQNIFLKCIMTKSKVKFKLLNQLFVFLVTQTFFVAMSIFLVTTVSLYLESHYFESPLQWQKEIISGVIIDRNYTHF